MAHSPYTDQGVAVGRTVLRNVRVFDGQELTGRRAVVIDGGVIGTEAGPDAQEVDCDGAVLLPGLIDTHAHLMGHESLKRMAAWGVTTCLEMADLPAEPRDMPGTTSVRGTGTPVIGPGGVHARIPGMARRAVVRGPRRAGRFVARRVAEGADFIKIIVEGPGEGGPDLPTIEAVVAAAHAHGRKVIAHASTHGAYRTITGIDADIVTHVPLGPPLEDDVVTCLARADRVVVPTLTMMKGCAEVYHVGEAFAGASRSVGALYRAGVPVLAGTDANSQTGVPFHPPHGESLHDELELLVDAGLTTVDALRAATCLPARHFGLPDRGAVTPGLRADLVLIDGDPLDDIRATRRIRQVWCAGVEHPTV
ncbi:amidohydrolase family protein [Streptomyces sp. SL13]|uniref:Amidohydrolase family protein n=1 Tax=Streptantibioticus silvisoli TaxID=2705255 RepID=A0AA90H099_9ACTN|nr:amidohydrolase family protein [Streptantibioticus silvisoli]MDI5970899.1 amidohydrolase family protein [Streptantibioticus silvisoli]